MHTSDTAAVQVERSVGSAPITIMANRQITESQSDLRACTSLSTLSGSLSVKAGPAMAVNQVELSVEASVISLRCWSNRA